MKFRIAVLGATGFIGTPYREEIRACSDEATIVSLCGRRYEQLAAAAKDDEADFCSDEWVRVINYTDVNLVLVCTPDALHYDAVMACAKNGLHVLCEKPMGLNASESKQMWLAYHNSQLGHFVPFWTRYVDVFRRAKEIYESGELGDIRAFVYRWHNPRPAAMPFTWRDDSSISSAGSIADVGSHAYDVVRWILKDEAKRVLTHADTITSAKPDLGKINLGEAIEWGGKHGQQETIEKRKGSTYDYASVSVEMNNGAVGTMVLSHATFLRKGVAPELELHGTEASLSIERIGGAVRLYRPNSEGKTVATLPVEEQGNRFKKYVFPCLRDQIEGRSSNHPNFEDGYRVQLFTDAAAHSAKQGGWVELSEIESSI